MEYSHLARVAAVYQGMAVGAYATHKLRKSLTANGLAKDEEVVGTLLVCQRCSIKLLPMENCTFTVKRTRRKAYKNRAVYTCSTCGHETVFKGTSKADVPMKTRATTPTKYTEEDIQRILNKVPVTHRSLGKKPELVSLFFSSKESDLYSLFH